ncbi:MAG: hypothetical protein Q4C93_01280, partial [Clostridia bacterium]|nr:hypothetical protein [Clostridia bacterium]
MIHVRKLGHKVTCRIDTGGVDVVGVAGDEADDVCRNCEDRRNETAAEAGLAIAEMIASISKPTVSLV